MFPMFLAPEAASAAASLPTNPVLAAVVAVAAAAADAVMSSDDNGDDNSNDDNGDESEAGDAASISPGDLSTAEYRVGLKKNLETELDNITTRGSFAAFAKLPELHPDLFVNDVGPVSLPLREAQAYQIIEKARQGLAPFSKLPVASERTIDARHQ